MVVREARLKNRRVALGQRDDGSYVLAFRKLEDFKSRSVAKTQIGLTPEAMHALVCLYMDIRRTLA